MDAQHCLNGAFLLHIHLEDSRMPCQCLVGYIKHGPAQVFQLGDLYRDIIHVAPHADLTKEIKRKDGQGDKITVRVNNQADWNKAVRELKQRQKELKHPQNITDCACLELFVKVDPLIKVRLANVQVPTLQKLAVNTVASLMPSDDAVGFLVLPQLLKSKIIAARNNKYADFVDGKLVIA